MWRLFHASFWITVPWCSVYIFKQKTPYAQSIRAYKLINNAFLLLILSNRFAGAYMGFLDFWLHLILRSSSDTVYHRLSIWGSSMHRKPTRSIPALRLRLALLSLLCTTDSFLATFAPKCASWSAVNQGTSGRSPCASLGIPGLPSVDSSNSMCARSLDYIDFNIYVAY